MNPGQHWVESAIVLAPDGYVRAQHLPTERNAEGLDSDGEPGAIPANADGDVALPLGLPLEEASRRYVEATVSACGGNKAEAARRLRVGRNTIGRTLKS